MYVNGSRCFSKSVVDVTLYPPQYPDKLGQTLIYVLGGHKGELRDNHQS